MSRLVEPGYSEMPDTVLSAVTWSVMFVGLAALAAGLVVAMRHRTLSGRGIAVAGLAVVVWAVSAWYLIAPVVVAGPLGDTQCPSAISSSTIRGNPDDSTLTATDRHCRDRGRGQLILCLGLGLAAGATAGTILWRSKRDTDPVDRDSIKA